MKQGWIVSAALGACALGQLVFLPSVWADDTAALTCDGSIAYGEPTYLPPEQLAELPTSELDDSPQQQTEALIRAGDAIVPDASETTPVETVVDGSQATSVVSGVGESTEAILEYQEAATGWQLESIAWCE